MAEGEAEFLDEKQTILTEDDVLHYRRLSIGTHPPSPSSSDSDHGCGDHDEDDSLLVDIILAQRPYLNTNVHKEQWNTAVRSTDHRKDDHFIYFPSGWYLSELQAKCQDMDTPVVTETVNGHDVNLYLSSNSSTVYCSEQKCPHAGGPLYSGTIEEVPETGQMCIVCPWHKYCFDLQTGHIKRPNHRTETLIVHPTRIEDNGSISIGFESFNLSCFTDDF